MADDEVVNPASLYWMSEVQRRAAALGTLKKMFRWNEATEYDIALMQGRLDYAIKQYTDPMGRKERALSAQEGMS